MQGPINLEDATLGNGVRRREPDDVKSRIVGISVTLSERGIQTILESKLGREDVGNDDEGSCRGHPVLNLPVVNVE